MEENIEASEHPPQTPDCSYVIVGLAGEHPEWLEQNTKETILYFMMEAGKRLHAIDPHWGYLTDVGPRSLTLPNNQTISPNSFIYDTTMQVVSVLRNELERKRKAQPHWVLMPGISEAHWYPIGGGEMDTSTEGA
jgi:hypothetical protein